MRYVVQYAGDGEWDLTHGFDYQGYESNLSNVVEHLRLNLLNTTKLDMKYTHLLELSTTEPRQYRITVVEEKPASMIAQVIEQGEGFKVVGWYDTPEELLEVLIPYLNMEQGK